MLTADLVDVLEGQAEGLVGGAAGGQDGVQGLQQGDPAGVAVLALHLPALEPAHLWSTGIEPGQQWGVRPQHPASYFCVLSMTTQVSRLLTEDFFFLGFVKEILGLVS